MNDQKRKYNRVLLINCAMDKISRKKIRSAVSSPNLGLLSIASMLTMHGYETAMIDFFVEDITVEDLAIKLNKFKPDVIGFSVYTRTEMFMRNMLRVLAKLEYKGKLIAGGPHATFKALEMLKETNLDYVIRREGEVAFVKLMEHLNNPKGYGIEGIRGISYRQEKNKLELGQSIKENPDQPLIKNLDALPLQAIDLAVKNKYSAPFTIITSRGCPGNCIYCASRAMSGWRYRMRSAENILCEIIYLSKKLNSRKLTILDDTFTADSIRLHRFMKLFKNIGKDYTYRIESRGDVLTEEILDGLYESRCKVIHVGIESGSQKVLDHIGKKVNLQKTSKMLKYGSKKGIHMVASFIIGHYCDTDETIGETLALMKELKENNVEVSVASCTPFPGTPIYNKAKKLGITIHAQQYQEYDFGNVIISTRKLSRNQLRQYLFEAIKYCA